MPRERLRTLLQELHAELERTDAVDETERGPLRSVMNDIQEALQRSQEEADPQGESLTARLRDSATSFEETHPNLAAAVGRVIDALSKLGI